MTKKYALLVSVVPVTFDAGFRPHGYEIVELLEADEKTVLPKGSLQALLDAHRPGPQHKRAKS